MSAVLNQSPRYPATSLDDVEPEWEVRPETLYFQFGPLRFGEASFRALSLASNPFVVAPDYQIPLSRAATESCRAVVVTAMPLDRPMATIGFDRGALRYAARYGDRYVVDLQGSFADYLKKFSKKSRGNLQRAAKKLGTLDGGAPDVREYRTPSEMLLFRDIAVAISRASYKNDIGWGFQEDEGFARQLAADAAAGRVRGYVLMFEGRPAAYVFCRIDNHVIVYKHIGYDERLTQRSPGTALLYLILERLFSETAFTMLDFDGTEYYPYKEFFATRKIRCARVFWLRPRAAAFAVVGAHWAVTAAWRLASALRGRFQAGRREWASTRSQAAR